MIAGGVFGTIAAIGFGVACYVLATRSGQNDVVAMMLFMAWPAASVLLAMGVASLIRPIRGVSGKACGADPDQIERGAWAAAEWSGEASVAFDAPAPLLVMLVSGLAFIAASVWLYAADRITIGGLFFTGLGGAFLVFWAWIGWRHPSPAEARRRRAARARSA